MTYVIHATAPQLDHPLLIGAFNSHGRARDALDHVRALGYDAELLPLWRGVDLARVPPAVLEDGDDE